MTVPSPVTALGAGQTSLFGNTQPKLGGTLGTGAFGAPGFNTSTATLGFGAPQPAVGECAWGWAWAQGTGLLRAWAHRASPWGHCVLAQCTLC